MSVTKAIMELISQETVISVPITETTDLYEDLYLDSLSFVSLLMDIEEQYNITIGLSEMADCHIVGQLINLVEKKIREETEHD
ncbi:acyl carrier protein [Dorea sp. D27]|uniref:acyl carrier protein n=1 Tax=Dorea sp. D27 TaxID=658665 RepID=UPI000673C627|nr:acyl carrier protein [Dorea sp. D27]KMZ53022.1 phosphopantetheine-binding protein [Dorea sp. D27]